MDMRPGIQPADKRQARCNDPMIIGFGLFDDRALGDQPCFQAAPKGDRQFTGKGNDDDAPDPPRAAPGPAVWQGPKAIRP